MVMPHGQCQVSAEECIAININTNIYDGHVQCLVSLQDITNNCNCSHTPQSDARATQNCTNSFDKQLSLQAGTERARARLNSSKNRDRGFRIQTPKSPFQLSKCGFKLYIKVLAHSFLVRRQLNILTQFRIHK